MANASTKALPYLAYSRVKHRRQHEQHREEQQSSLEPYQRPPDGDWRWWLFMAGRWSGKTYAGATWLNERAETEAGCRVAVIAPTLNDAAETCVLGPAGLLKINPAIRFIRPHTLIWTNGSRGRLFGAYMPEDVERLRGPEFNYAWGDEVATWRMLDNPRMWSNLEFCLRAGENPRAILTTTPKPRPKMFDLVASGRTVVTKARSSDNPHIHPDVQAELYAEYGDSDIAAQELEGELLQDSPDAFIPLSWLYEAVERDQKRDGTICAGLDLARFGADRTALVITVDSSVLAMEERQGQGLMDTVGWVLEYARSHEIQALAVDEGGLGAGVVDRLAELIVDPESGANFMLVPITNQKNATDTLRYHNKGTEMWARVRDTVSPEAPMPLTLPGQHPLTQRLIMQLAGARRAYDSVGHGRIWLDKTGSGHYGGRDDGTQKSPDLADALALSLEAWSVYWTEEQRPTPAEYHRDSWLGGN